MKTAAVDSSYQMHGLLTNNNLNKFISYPENADKTKDLFNCRVLHHSKAAGAVDSYPNELSPSSPDVTETR